jgi:hypothetical protein
MSASDVDAFLGLLRGLSSGHLTICDDRGGEYSFGDVASGPSARVIVHDKGLYSRILRDGELGPVIVPQDHSGRHPKLRDPRRCLITRSSPKPQPGV